MPAKHTSHNPVNKTKVQPNGQTLTEAYAYDRPTDVGLEQS